MLIGKRDWLFMVIICFKVMLLDWLMGLVVPRGSVVCVMCAGGV